jgi:MinD superfamily P-loop ATPase
MAQTPSSKCGKCGKAKAVTDVRIAQGEAVFEVKLCAGCKAATPGKLPAVSKPKPKAPRRSKG